MSRRGNIGLEKQVEILKKYNDIQSCRKVAKLYSVSKDTVRRIVKRKSEIESSYELGIPLKVRRTINEDINKLTYKWSVDMISRNIKISGPILQAQARKFAKDLDIHSFSGSNGWLESFIKRNQLKTLTSYWDSTDVNKQLMDNWNSNINNICAGYKHEDIYNMEETVLLYRTNTKCKTESDVDSIKPLERLTIALCASASGEKFKPFVIGNCAKPISFKKIKNSSLPVYYRVDGNAWMTTALFENWLSEFDKEMKSLKRRVILLLDKSPSHTSVMLTNTKIVFLPRDTTLQPMSQGIIHKLKLKYRLKQMAYVLDKLESDKSLNGQRALKSISILDAIYWIHQAWTEVESRTIENCFSHSGLSMSDASISTPNTTISDSILTLANDAFQMPFIDIVRIDEHLASGQSAKNWNLNARELLGNQRDADNVDDGDKEDGVISNDTVSSHLDDIEEYCINNGNHKLLEAINKAQSIVREVVITKT